MMRHVHTIPVDSSLDATEAWREICIFGRRVTFTGTETWAVIRCDGDECQACAAAGRRSDHEECPF